MSTERGENLMYGGAGEDSFRFDGRNAGGVDTLLDFSFEEGDSLKLIGYQENTFEGGDSAGLNLFSDGKTATIKSLDGLVGLVSAAADVSAKFRPDEDRLTIAIEQGVDVHEIELVEMAASYQAAAGFDLI